jgi:hypothetical protein
MLSLVHPLPVRRGGIVPATDVQYPVRDQEAETGAELAELLAHLLDRVDPVVEVERLATAGVLPLERQARVDGMALRRQFPTLRMVGHFDKMTMNRGEAAMRAEFDRLVSLMKTGGFIPSVDHQTPPGVSLEEYGVYIRLLREYMDREHP